MAERGKRDNKIWISIIGVIIALASFFYGGVMNFHIFRAGFNDKFNGQLVISNKGNCMEYYAGHEFSIEGNLHSTRRNNVLTEVQPHSKLLFMVSADSSNIDLKGLISEHYYNKSGKFPLNIMVRYRTKKGFETQKLLMIGWIDVKKGKPVNFTYCHESWMKLN